MAWPGSSDNVWGDGPETKAIENRPRKPTNEALRAWAAAHTGHCRVIRVSKPPLELKVSVPQWGTVQVTEKYAFVEAVIEVPLTDQGEIAE